MAGLVNAMLPALRQDLSLHPGPADTGRLGRVVRAARPTWSQWLLKNYLFVRLPLLRPAALLDRLAPWVAGVFDRRFWAGVVVRTLVGLYLASRQWDTFIHTFASYTTVAGIVGIGLALSFAKVLHEMGHALTAQHFGCRVPTMGVALLVLVPVLYTDTNEAWKLPSRRQRLAIAGAGMLSELALAALSTLAWSFLPDGPLRAGAFLLAVELGWFIALPIGNEAEVWLRRRGDLRWNRVKRRTAVVAALIAGFLLLPWRSDVRAPERAAAWAT